MKGNTGDTMTETPMEKAKRQYEQAKARLPASPVRGLSGSLKYRQFLRFTPGLRRPSEYLHRRKSYPATLFLPSKWSAERCEIPCLREIVRDRAISGENMRHCAKSRGFMRLPAIFGEELSPEQSKPVQKSRKESNGV